MADTRPWSCKQNSPEYFGRIVGRSATRKAAMNLVDGRPYQRGIFTVKHKRTGETWVRRGGSWSKTS